jgi:uracil-DNA glycosylase family 4
MTTTEKISALAALEAEIAADKKLPLLESNLVFGEGNVDCGIMFIGEAPGFNEDQQRRPFVGRGGQLLNQMIESIGWKRSDVYITNIVKRRPPENRDPLPGEIEVYKPYLTRQIEIIDPKVIAPLGRFSMNYFLPDAKMMRDHGRVMFVNLSEESLSGKNSGISAAASLRPLERLSKHSFEDASRLAGNSSVLPMEKALRVGSARGRVIFPILHPAAALRAPEMMKAFREDFAKLPSVVAGNGASEIVLPPALTEKPKSPKAKQERLF